MNKKIKKSSPPSGNASISEAKQSAGKRATELINFSLKYLDTEHTSFQYGAHDTAYFCEVLSRLKAVSGLMRQEILSNRSSTLRAHPIDWNDTSLKKGFNIPEEKHIVDVPYQFAVSSNEMGRIHGFFIYNTFYIVWLDKEHNLYP